MKKSIKIALFTLALMAFINTSFIACAEQNTPATTKQSINTQTDNAQEQLDQIKQQLTTTTIPAINKTLDTITEYAHSNLHHNAQSDAITKILHLRKTILTIQSSIQTSENIDDMAQKFNQIVCLHDNLKKVVTSNVQNIPEFNAELAVSSYEGSKISSSNDLQKAINSLTPDLTTLQKDADYLGLTKKNIWYRNWINPSLEFAQRNNLDFWVTTGLGVISIAGYCYFNSDNGMPQEKNPNMFRRIVGWPEKSPNNHKAYEIKKNNDDTITRVSSNNLRPLIPLSDIESNTRTLVSAAVPIGLVTKYCFKDQAEALWSNVAQSRLHLMQMIYDQHYKCMGGEIYRNYQKQMSKNYFSYFQLPIKTRFSHLIGCEDAIEHGKTIIQHFKEQKFAPERGLFLHGLPGVGKSMFAAAMAGELQEATEGTIGYVEITSANIKQKGGLDACLAQIKRFGPCVVFFDEIDLFLNSDATGELLTRFLSGINNLICNVTDPKKQIIVIGAANTKDFKHAEAVLRRGRLGKTLYIDHPKTEDRALFLLNELQSYIDWESFKEVFQQSLPLTQSCTIEDLKALVKNALMIKEKKQETMLSRETFKSALYETILGINQSPKINLSSNHQKLLAFHMAAHTVMSLLLGSPLECVTIKPVIPKKPTLLEESYQEDAQGQIYGNIFPRMHASTEGVLHTDLMKKCKILLAGNITSPCTIDSRTCSGTCKKRAFDIAKKIVLNGLDENQLSTQKKDAIKDEALALITKLEEETKTFLENKADLIAVVAGMLHEKQTITPKEIVDVVNRINENAAKPTPKEADEPAQDNFNESSPIKNIDSKKEELLRNSFQGA